MVILVGGGGGIAWWLLSPSAPPEPPLQGRIAWQTATAAKKRDILGSWSTETVVAQLSTGKLVGFTKATGRPAWTITLEQLPELPSAGLFCDSSRVVGGLGVVSFGVRDVAHSPYSESCYGLMLIDVNTGIIRWTTMLPSTDEIGLPVDSKLRVDIAGDVVVYGHHKQYAAVRLSSGQPAWSYDAPECRPHDHEGSRKAVVATLACANDVPRMIRLRAGDGSVASSTQLASDYSAVVTADPPILLNSNGSVLNPRFGYAVFDSHGRKQATIPDASPVGELEVLERDMGAPAVEDHHHYPVVVAHGMLIVPTQSRRSPVSPIRFTNHVMAYDLETGRIAWSRQLAKDYTAVPFAASKQGVLAITGGTAGDPTHLVRLSWDDGAPTRLSKPYPGDRVLFGISTSHRLYWDDHTVYGINLNGPQFGPTALALR